MEQTNNKCRYVFKEDLAAEIASRAAALDFSQTARGPNCSGCYNLVFERMCMHAYVFRKRCDPKGVVCSGSDILTVHIDGEDTCVVMRRADCAPCLSLYKARQKSAADDSETTRKHAEDVSPRIMAAKVRMSAVKEVWQRKTIENGLAAEGSTRRDGGEIRKFHLEVLAARRSGDSGQLQQLDTTEKRPASE